MHEVSLSHYHRHCKKFKLIFFEHPSTLFNHFQTQNSRFSSIHLTAVDGLHLIIGDHGTFTHFLIRILRMASDLIAASVASVFRVMYWSGEYHSLCGWILNREEREKRQQQKWTNKKREHISRTKQFLGRSQVAWFLYYFFFRHYYVFRNQPSIF